MNKEGNEVEELKRDDPALQAPEAPETETEQKKGGFTSLDAVEAHRSSDTSAQVEKQREKAK
jgi:hypothetical protein